MLEFATTDRAAGFMRCDRLRFAREMRETRAAAWDARSRREAGLFGQRRRVLRSGFLELPDPQLQLLDESHASLLCHAGPGLGSSAVGWRHHRLAEKPRIVDGRRGVLLATLQRAGGVVRASRVYVEATTRGHVAAGPLRVRNGAKFNMIDWKRIEGFIGFGRSDAPVVFVGMEEGLADWAALDEDLALRSTYSIPVMDLIDAQNEVGGVGAVPRSPTWDLMADLMVRRHGKALPTIADRRSYRAYRLGRCDGETLLTELLPYPHPKASDWLYARFGRYATRAAYVTAMLPERVRLLQSILGGSQRELIVCYGKAHWFHYESLFPKALWQDDGLFRVAQEEKTRIVLAPHFTAYGCNTPEHLGRLAEVALSPSVKI